MRILILLTTILGLTAFSRKKESPTEMHSVLQANDWDPSFVIHMHYGGGMQYASDDIYIRYDSCVYIAMQQGVDHVYSFAMNDGLRAEVMDALKKYRAAEIRSEMSEGLTYDKATRSICISGKNITKNCFSSGSSTEILKEYAADFIDLSNWISGFAGRGGKK